MFYILILRLTLVVLALLAGSQTLWAETVHSPASASNRHVFAQLISNTKAIVAGKPFKLGVLLTMQPGWHTYYKNPGEAGMPTKIEWVLPVGFRAQNLTWERPLKFEEGGITTFGYQDKTLIASEILPPVTLNEDNIDIVARIKWLSCHELCVPGAAVVRLKLPVLHNKGNKKSLVINQTLFSEANFDGPPTGLKAAIVPGGAKPPIHIEDESFQSNDLGGASNNTLPYFIFAFVGGIILNFMPCVLPVIAIKVLSLLEQSDQDHKKVASTGLAFSSGIMTSFLALAFLVIGLRTIGSNVGWGFQFQYPPFLIAMSSLLVVFSLSLFGLFDFSIPQSELGLNQLADRNDLLGDFSKGVLATILSTPCTAPFLGTALGFAFVQPWWIILSIFAAVGVGMSLPYLLLALNPRFLKVLPKPGLWMQKLKESMGFLLLAAVVWLLSVLAIQIGLQPTISILYFLITLAFIIWMLGRFTDLTTSKRKAIFVRLLCLTLVVFSGYIFLYQSDALSSIFPKPAQQNPAATRASNSNQQSFDLDKLNKSLNAGNTVFLDFSAKWCLTCQVNEGTVINTEAVQKKMRDLNVVFLKADWTNQDPTITRLLRKFNRSGVPLYVIFPAHRPNQPIVLPEIITTNIVLEKLDEAARLK